MLRVILFLFLVPFSFMVVQAATPPDVEHRIHRHVASNSWGDLYYDVLPRIIEQYNYKSVVEIGVGLGGHAEHLLVNTAIDTYVGIDPFVYDDPSDPFSCEVAQYSLSDGQQGFDYLHEWIRNTRMLPFLGRGHIVRKPSVEAAAFFEDQSIDCIFIDGDHRYRAVFNDLIAWFPKLKEGGMIIGDDYWMPNVQAAVNAFFWRSERKEMIFFTSAKGYKLWAVIK